LDPFLSPWIKAGHYGDFRVSTAAQKQRQVRATHAAAKSLAEGSSEPTKKISTVHGGGITKAKDRRRRGRVLRS
jgi:hypothetical protein